MRGATRIGFAVRSADIRNSIFTPRYYDPSIDNRLDELGATHDLVSLQELIDAGELELRQGKYIDKMNYGTGPVPYIRTSDLANWELRASPKHGMSRSVADQYRSFMDVREADVLLVHEGTYLIGTSCLLTRFDTDILFQHHLAKLRASGDRINGPLLMACLMSPVVQRQIRARQFTADVIDSIVGRLPEVRLPLHKSMDRRLGLSATAKKIFDGRAEARVRIAILTRGLDQASVTGEFEQLVQEASVPAIGGSGHVSFLGGAYGSSTFTVAQSSVRGTVLIPRYYDPVAATDLKSMAMHCDLVTIGDLVRDGVLELGTGDEVGKLAYGSGDVGFVRTSDFGNWELKHDPKQRISRDVYDHYSAKQSARSADVLLVRDGTYLVGTTSIVQERDLPLLFSAGIYRLRVRVGSRLSPGLLLALLSMKVVKRQMRNKQFTRDVIDTLGHRLLEVVLPIPTKAEDRELVSRAMEGLLAERESLRGSAAGLSALVEAA